MIFAPTGIRLHALLLVLLAALPGFVLVPYVALQQREAATAEARENIFNLAQQVSQDQRQHIAATRYTLQYLSTLLLANDPNLTQCGEVLTSLLQQSSQYENLGAVNPEGDLLCSAMPSQTQNVGDRVWLKNVLQSQDFALGEYHVSPITQTPTLVLGYPVFNQSGEIQLILFASLNLPWLNALLNYEQLSEDATINITDRQGVILARYPNPQDWVGESIADTILFQDLLAAQDNAIKFSESFGLQGHLQIFTFSELAPEQLTDLYITVGIPQADIIAEANQTALKSGLLVGIVTGLVLFLANLGSQLFIIQPVNLLVEKAKRLAQGNLSERVGQPYRSGELGELARAFDEMAATLEEQRVAEHLAIQRERELTELKANFTSMVSHEFRTPLTVIRMAIDLLENFGDRLSATQQQQYFHRLRSAVRHMNHLMEDVLLIGQVEEGRLAVNPVCLNLVAFCTEIMEEMDAESSPQHDIEFTAEGDCTAVNLDAKILRSIVTNLLTNALKYSPQGGTIQFRINCQSEQASLEIQDEGIGIPPADLTRLFESFQRASNVGTIQGTGLGLAIVKRYVDLLGGEITATSEVGRGTTFRVVLPFAHGGLDE